MRDRSESVSPAFWGTADDDEALQRFRTLVNAVDDAIYQLDADNRFVAVNDELVALTGYSRTDLLGEHVSIVLPEADLERIERDHSRRLTADDDPSETFEVTIRTADGETVPCEVRLTFLLEGGEVTGTVGIVQDVSERQRRRRRRERELEQYRALTEAASDVVVTIDAESTIQTINPAVEDVFGYEPSELIGESLTALMPSRLTDQHREALDRYLETSERTLDWDYVELPGARADGTEIPLAVSFSEVEYAGERYFTGIVRDITERKEIEQQLRDRERRLEQYREYTDDVLDAVEDVFYVLDEEGALRRWNESFRSVTGYTDAEIGELHALEFFEGEDREAAAAAIREGFETGSVTVELELSTRSGGAIPYEFEASRLEDPEGRPVLAGIGRDITARRERKRELERKERRYEAIFEDPNILVGLLEPDGTVLDINETAMEYIDADLADVIGDLFWETPWWGEGDGVQNDVRTWVRRAADGEYVDFEADLTRPDGREYTLNGYFRPVTDEDGDVVSIIVSDRDITERKRRERDLEESKQRYRTLIENFPNGAVALVDEDLRYVTFGGTPEATDVTRADLEGEPLREALPEELAAIVVPRYEDALEGESAAFEETVGDRTYQYHFLPVRDEDGEVFAAMGLSQDITERREYERRLETSNERLEQFAYAASHDLQEPLRMVSSYLRLIEDRYGDRLDEDGEEFLQFAVEGADRMREMIDGLLAYSRVETEGDPFEPVALEGVLDDVLDDLQFQIEETDATITRDPLPVVSGDSNQLRQVFQNLLENALEYSGDEPPRIHVGAERADGGKGEGDEWTVSVTDEGIGIDPADQDRVFEVFQRLHSRGEHSGTGIGLALCERILERHGGEIRVDSEPGEGATFSMTLPAAE